MWVMPDDIAWCAEPAGDKVWVIRVRTGRTVGMSPTSLAIWHHAPGCRTVEQLTDDLVASYGWERSQIRPHVQQIIEHFVAVGLLDEVENP